VQDLPLTCNSTTQIVALIDFVVYLVLGSLQLVWYPGWGVINGVLFGIAGFRGENDRRFEFRQPATWGGGRCLATLASLLGAPQLLVVLVFSILLSNQGPDVFNISEACGNYTGDDNCYRTSDGEWSSDLGQQRLLRDLDESECLALTESNVSCQRLAQIVGQLLAIS
jgi:hypothetical protein